MAAGPLEHAGQARTALQAIVSDPQHGAAALDSPQTISNLLGDLLPDAPRESGLMMAAAAAGLPGALRGHIAQGLDPATAITLAAAALAGRTAFTADACQWVAGELAIALGLAPADQLVPPPDRQPTELAWIAGIGRPEATEPRTRSARPELRPAVQFTPPLARPARHRGVVLIIGAVITAAAVTAAVVLIRSPGGHLPDRTPGVSTADSGLVTRRPPGGGYTVSLPASWKFRNASYPSDHATHLWYDPANPLQKMQVVLSGCVGCADQNLNPAVPDPRQLVPPGAVSRTRVSPWEERFRLYTSDDPYPDNGEIIVLQASGQVTGYDQIQLWLPASRRHQAAAILASFTVPPTRGSTSPSAPHAASPRAVVLAYLAAINQRDWPRVWQLGGKNLGPSYRQMIAGYRYTSEIVIIAMTVHSGAVTVRVRAYETTGAVQTYHLSYLVSGGTIIAGQQTLLRTSG